uniref:Uncharacterized protein n=1 Tax=Arundo donax TaxID=35708 RepID=A0A0A9EYP9_ARUDO
MHQICKCPSNSPLGYAVWAMKTKPYVILLVCTTAPLH